MQNVADWGMQKWMPSELWPESLHEHHFRRLEPVNPGYLLPFVKFAWVVAYWHLADAVSFFSQLAHQLYVVFKSICLDFHAFQDVSPKHLVAWLSISKPCAIQQVEKKGKHTVAKPMDSVHVRCMPLFFCKP